MTSRWRNAASQHRDLVNNSWSIFNKHTSDSSVWLVTTLFHHLRFAVIMNLILKIFQRLGCKMTQFIYRLKNYRQFIASLRSNPSPCRHKKWAFFLFTKRAFYFRKSDSIDFGNNAWEKLMPYSRQCYQFPVLFIIDLQPRAGSETSGEYFQNIRTSHAGSVWHIFIIRTWVIYAKIEKLRTHNIWSSNFRFDIFYDIKKCKNNQLKKQQC
jgi:hypothetical protein